LNVNHSMNITRVYFHPHQLCLIADVLLFGEHQHENWTLDAFLPEPSLLLTSRAWMYFEVSVEYLFYKSLYPREFDIEDQLLQLHRNVVYQNVFGMLEELDGPQYDSDSSTSTCMNN